MLQIGGKKIQPYLSPFFIAEVSANHLGSLNNALKIVELAANAGADAIKLQTFTADSLTLNCDTSDFFINDPESLWNGRKLWDLYHEAHTPIEWHEPIFDHAKSFGLKCISSAFDLESIKLLQDLQVDAIKIASFEIVHLPLISEAARTGLPIIISTGMATLDEINEAVETLHLAGCKKFSLLKCTSAYPSTEKQANIASIIDMRQKFACEIGLSDHCLRPYSTYAAVACGASIIEKHLTVSRSDGGPDADFSLEPKEFQEMVEGAKLICDSIGQVTYKVLPQEETSHKERPSIYVSADILEGEKISKNNVRIVRPGFGLSPKFYHQIIGARASQDIVRGAALKWDMLSTANGED
jgi:pseudaminic acid synthase